MKNEWIIGGIAAAVCTVGTYLFGSHVKKEKEEVQKIKEDIQKERETLVKALEGRIDAIDVPDSYIYEAVERVVEKEVKSQVRMITTSATSTMKLDIHREVRGALDDVYCDIKPCIKEELTKQIGNLSIEQVKREVMAEAKEKAAKQFEESLEEVLEKHNRELDKVTQIYSSIAKSMKGDN